MTVNQAHGAPQPFPNQLPNQLPPTAPAQSPPTAQAQWPGGPPIGFPTSTPVSHETSRSVFVNARTARWEEMDRLAANQSLDAQTIRRLGSLYRATSADLSLARQMFPNDPMIAALEQKLEPARSVVYRRRTKLFSIKEFYRDRYWRLIMERPWLLAASVALLVVPTIATYLWALKDPDRAGTMLGGRFSGGRTSWEDQGYAATEQAAIATEIFINNIRVSLMCFALGVTAGLGTAYLLVFNGVLLGIVAGVSTSDGHGDVAFTLIYAHGFLELTIIAIAAAAGMRMGWAIVQPGLRSRSIALREESVRAVEIVLGTIPFFILAGLVEGFFTPAGYGPVWAGIVGTLLGGGYWFLLFARGRTRRTRPQRGAAKPRVELK